MQVSRIYYEYVLLLSRFRVNRWLGVRLEAMGTIMNLAAALLIVLSKYTDALSIKAGIAGLVLTYTQQVLPSQQQQY